MEEFLKNSGDLIRFVLENLCWMSEFILGGTESRDTS